MGMNLLFTTHPESAEFMGMAERQVGKPTKGLILPTMTGKAENTLWHTAFNME